MSNLVKLIIIVALIAAIPVTVKLVQQQQILKSRAADSPQCTDGQGGYYPQGTSCGDGKVCDGSGDCIAQTSSNPCADNLGNYYDSGTSCGSGRVCDGRGNCVAASSPCADGLGNYYDAGTSCGGGKICDGQGNCRSTSGDTSNPCRGVWGNNFSQGTYCGTGKICDGRGTCIASTGGGTGGQQPPSTGTGGQPSGTQVCVPGSYNKACTGRCGGCAADAGEQEIKQCNADGSGWGTSYGECNTVCVGACAGSSNPVGGNPVSQPGNVGVSVPSGSIQTCLGTRAWDDIDNGLRVAGGSPIGTHDQAELDSFNRASCPNSSGSNCVQSYTLDPSSPAPNTPMKVTVHRSYSPDAQHNVRCFVLYNDGSNVSIGPPYGCTAMPPQISNGQDVGGDIVCTVNSGSPGQHTLQAKYGVQEVYPASQDCLQRVTCNSITYTAVASSYTIAGKVVDSNNNALAGITVNVNDDKGTSKPLTTDANGQFSIADFIKASGGYAVRIPVQTKVSDPNSQAKITTVGWTWQYAGSNAGKDMDVNTASSYEFQQAGSNDCAGPAGSGGASGRCSFKITSTVVILTAPSCNTPASESTINPNNVSFSWGAVTGATSYEFRLWDYRAGGWDDAHWIKESVGKTGLTTTSYDGTQGQTFIYNGVMTNDDYRSPINLTAGRNYRYRVAARNSAGIGPWSDCNFTVSSSPSRIEFRVAESPTALAGAPWEAYTGAGMSRNYTFQNQAPGLKTIFVDFRDSDGNTQSETVQIELLVPPSPSPVPSPSAVPSPSVIPSLSPSPSPAPVYTTAYRLAENLADFTDTPYSPQNPHGWQPYTRAGVVASYGFDNQNAGLKTVLVQYKDSNGRVTCDGASNYCSVQVRLLGDAPEKRSCSLGTDGSTAILNIIGINFGSTQGTAATGTTARQIRQWRDNNVQVDWPSAPIGQNLNVALTTVDGQSVDVTCSSLSQLALGARVFCRQPSLHQTANVNLTLAEAIPSGRLVRERVSIDKDGVVQGITQRLEEGRQYNLSIKAPKALRKTATFTAGPGTTNVPNFILWVGDIFPADGGDGLINGLDKGELNRQWNVLSEVKGRPGDFNQDDRVNSIDWACMRVSMVDANGRGDDPEAVPGLPPVISPRPTASPSSSPTVSPSPSASPGT